MYTHSATASTLVRKSVQVCKVELLSRYRADCVLHNRKFDCATACLFLLNSSSVWCQHGKLLRGYVGQLHCCVQLTDYNVFISVCQCQYCILLCWFLAAAKLLDDISIYNVQASLGWVVCNEQLLIAFDQLHYGTQTIKPLRCRLLSHVVIKCMAARTQA